MPKRSKSRVRTRLGPLAAMLLWGSVVTSLTACLIPQEDQIITELPEAANRPPRILQEQVKPEQRESTARLGPQCPRARFEVTVDDPNTSDRINARWFIDPNERYVAEPGKPVVQGNPGALTSGSTIRLLQANTQFLTQLASFRGVHRVEVIVTDGEFIESEKPDGNGDPVPYLDVFRPSFRSSTGEVIPVEAYRDEFVWIVDVDTAPCP